MILLTLTTNYDGMSAIWTNYYASIGLIVGLGLLGTGLAYIIYYYIASKMGAVTASSVSYIPPLVALLIGSAIVGEPIELVDYFATALIFIGVYVLKRK
jgi:drug/metabolite transporter (DMT)-like permease